MLAASAGDAVMALMLVLVVRHAAPVWTGFGAVVGVVFGAAVYLGVRFRRLVCDGTLWRAVGCRRMLLSRGLLLACVGRMEFAALAWSVTLVPPAVSAILFALWPMMFVLFLERSSRSPAGDGQPRYRRVGPETATYFGVAFAGLAFVVAAQHTAADAGGIGEVLTGSAVAGVGLAVLSAFLAACNAFVYPWSLELCRRVELETDVSRFGLSRDDLEIASAMLGTLLSTVCAAPILLLLSFAEPNPDFSIRTLATMILAGATLVTCLLVLQRRANLGTDNLGVNAIAYTTPVFAVALFAVFDVLGEARMDFVTLGASAIVAMNLFLNYNPDYRLGFNRRAGFKGLVIGMWAVGCAVYMRDDWLPQTTTGLNAADYWTLIGLIATMVTLILSFRASRQQTRTVSEEQHTATSSRELEELVRRGTVHRTALRAFIRMDAACRPAGIAQHYSALRCCFRHARRPLPEPDTRTGIGADRHLPDIPSGSIAAAEADIDVLVSSKQSGRDFTEVVAAVMLGIVAVTLLAITRPPLAGWAAFANDIASVVVSAVIVFLVMNLFDPRNERRSPLIHADTANRDEHSVLLEENTSPIFEQAMSIAVAAGITVMFAGLLGQKWL